MQIDEQKIHARFANACPDGAPADLIALMRNRLDIDRGNYLRQNVQHWKARTYERANELYKQIQALKTVQAETQAREAELQRQLDQLDPLTVTAAQAGDMLNELAGCEPVLKRIADTLSQAKVEREQAEVRHKELAEMAHIVDELTRRWTVMTPETKAELLADFLTDAEHARFFTPEYLEQKRIAQEKAEAERKQAQEREEEHRRWKAEQRAAERAPYDRIDAMTVPEILEEVFAPHPPPETLLWHVRTRQAIHEGCAPHLWNFQKDAMKVYALNQVIHRVSQNLPID